MRSVTGGKLQTRTNNIKVEDLALVEQCRGGDTAAMQRLIVKYQDRIYNVILRMCRNADDAAELTQDAFVKVLENIENFRARSSFYTWLFRIAVNLTLNYCKRRVKLPAASLDEERVSANASAQLKVFLADDGSPDPAAVAENKELCELLYVALNKLDENHRAVVVLRDIEGMSYADIAETLEVETGTVKSRLSRARAGLREVLESLI